MTTTNTECGHTRYDLDCVSCATADAREVHDEGDAYRVVFDDGSEGLLVKAGAGRPMHWAEAHQIDCATATGMYDR